MADSVDTQIENAYNRALSWGYWSAANSQAAVDVVDGFRSPPTRPIKQPTMRASQSSLPTIGTTPATGNKPAVDLEAQLNDFFDDLFPPTDGAFAWAAGWVVETLGGTVSSAVVCSSPTVAPTIIGGPNGTTMPGAFDAAYGTIWNNASQYITATGDVSNLARPAAAVSRAQDVSSIISLAKADTLSKVRAALWKIAAGMKIADLRRDALQAVGSYIRAKAALDMADKQMEMAIEKQLMQVERALTAWYTASIDATETASQIAMTRGDEIVGLGSTVAESMEKKIHNMVSAGIAGSSTMASVAQAANASMNSVVGSSTVGFG